jgi:hypothetical protein
MALFSERDKVSNFLFGKLLFHFGLGCRFGFGKYVITVFLSFQYHVHINSGQSTAYFLRQVPALVLPRLHPFLRATLWPPFTFSRSGPCRPGCRPWHRSLVPYIDLVSVYPWLLSSLEAAIVFTPFQAAWFATRHFRSSIF